VSERIADSLAAAAAVRVARSALADREAVWIVGGAIRDAALGGDVLDVDLVVADGEEEVARAVAGEAGGSAFQLSEEFATWRAVSHQGWHVDVARLRAAGIDADLSERDFTVNAIALPLAGGDPIDPHDGFADLDRRELRAVGPRSFADDPLRILRAARLAAALGFAIEAGTVELARAESSRAADPAGERQLAELRALITGPAPLAGLEAMDELGVTEVVLPELAALRGVEQNPYHHLDVHGHTLEVLGRLLEMERELGAVVGELADPVAELVAEPLADEMTRGGALRFAALFHDLGKPETRAVSEEGRVLFIGHDHAGARIVRGICERLRASRRLSSYLESITLNHLRLGFLVHERPLSRRSVYEYLKATDPESVDVTLLTVADRLATQGPRTQREAIDSHLELAREMISEALAWRRDGPPSSPIRGDELAAEVGVERGPELGRLLREIEAARFAGEVETRDDAIELARRLAG
jgi:putative nucleotidyltransferase with HDIG domain